MTDTVDDTEILAQDIDQILDKSFKDIRRRLISLVIKREKKLVRQVKASEKASKAPKREKKSDKSEKKPKRRARKAHSSASASDDE